MLWLLSQPAWNDARGAGYAAVVCLSYGKPREIPRYGCYRNRHGMTLGVRVTPLSCAYPMASLGRFHAMVAIATGME